MHIWDSLLDARTAAATGAISVAGLGIALRCARANLPPRRVPLMGLTAAFIFAAQMINFPVGAGTSGHLVGGVLAATLVGPAAAVVVMSAVIIIQALFFADGGVTALGANVLNMAIVGVIAGYLIYAMLRRFFPGERGRIVAAAFAGWCSTVLAAGFCGIELVLSGRGWVVLPVMLGWHMLIGIGEATITALVLSAIARARPELLDDGASASPAVGGRTGMLVALGLALALVLAIFFSPLKSHLPDGLEKAAQMLAIAGEQAPAATSPLPDYRFPGIRSAAVATAVAGGVGTIIAFALSLVLARILVPKAHSAPAPAEETMSHDFLDRFSRLNSPVHRLPAGLKMLTALALILSIVLIPIGHWRLMSIAAILLIAIALLSRIPLRFLARRLILLEPLVLGVAILTLLKRDGGITFLSILIKSTLCLLTMILLSNTTPFSRMIGVLRTIRTPGLLVTTLALMYRYIFVLLDEGHRMRRARLSRTFAHSRWRTWRSLGTVIGQLFIRSSERAERIYSAMVARGWR